MNTRLNKQDFKDALDALSQKVAADARFDGAYLPLRFVVVGGFVSICHLRHRHTTEDIDFFYPGVLENEEYKDMFNTELQQLIEEVADERSLSYEWANSGIAGAWRGPDEASLLDRSYRQNVLLYSSPHIEVYAGDWMLQLSWKVVAVGTRDKPVDLEDAVAIGHLLWEQFGGRPVKTSELRTALGMRLDAVKVAYIGLVNEAAKSKKGHPVIHIDYVNDHM
ncbi:hypothetical protein FB451DRAFT_396935 [Mycena latifolia]|nr:hypothetical protein FB451DRAFT_396935 [Mycena latifolia]